MNGGQEPLVTSIDCYLWILLISILLDSRLIAGFVELLWSPAVSDGSRVRPGRASWAQGEEHDYEEVGGRTYLIYKDSLAPAVCRDTWCLARIFGDAKMSISWSLAIQGCWQWWLIWDLTNKLKDIATMWVWVLTTYTPKVDGYSHPSKDSRLVINLLVSFSFPESEICRL